MRTMVRERPGSDGRARARARLALAGLLALFASLVLPGLAHAATHPAKLDTITITPALAGHPTFGLYHFTVSAANAGDSFAYPFAVGPKIGHCVEATNVINSDTGLLRTGADLSLENGDPQNTLGTGLTVGAQQLEWILLDSYKNSPGDATGVEGAAHQSAIWQLTNPSSPTVIHINGSQPAEQATAARTAQLLAGAQANYASVANTGDLTVDGGAALHTCGGTTRTVTVSGSPFTDATLTLSGVGHFDTGGGTTTTVALGATGQAQVQVDSTGPGTIDVTATVQIATMVQADNGGNQDFVYLEFKPVQTQVEIVFNDCQNLQLANTASPAFSRSYDWTIAKSVDQTSITTSENAATFNYTVTATKGAATDGGWKVTGSISITNPNATSVLGVQIAEQGVSNGGICALDGSGAIGTVASGQSGSVGYTCTYAAAPDPTMGVNTALVSWTLPSSGTPAVTSSASVTQSFAFGAPTLVHDAVDVADSFDGASLVGLAGGTAITSSATFTYSRTVAVPATACQTFDNIATVTATDTPAYTKGSAVSVQACRQAPPVGPASIPTTTVTLAKRASSPTVEAGGTVGFTIVWKNTGKATAKNVVICDRLPDQLTFVSAKGAAFKNGKACWTRASVGTGATLTFRVTARAAADVGNVKLVNVATATASNAKPARATAPVRARRHARTRPAGVTG